MSKIKEVLSSFMDMTWDITSELTETIEETFDFSLFCRCGNKVSVESIEKERCIHCYTPIRVVVGDD